MHRNAEINSYSVQVSEQIIMGVHPVGPISYVCTTFELTQVLAAILIASLGKGF